MIIDILKILWPVLLVQVILQIVALINLRKRKQVRFHNKWIWVAIIIFGEILGPIAYFLFRGSEDEDSSQD